MIYRLAADAVLVIHLLFIVFAVLGALLVLRFRWMSWLHLPAAAWAVYIEIFRVHCPLTTLENFFLEKAGLESYAGGFISHYLTALIYPAGLTPEVQYILAAAIVLINALIYGRLIFKHHSRT